MRLGRLHVEAFSEELTLTLPENPRSTGATERVMIDYALTRARALERGENLLDGVDLEGASGALTVTTSEGRGGALSQTHAPVGALSPGGEPVD